MAKKAEGIEKVVVVGAGTMGHGIAQVCAMAGCSVRLVDVEASAVQRGLDAVRKNLDKGVEKGKVTDDARKAALANLVGTTDLEKAAHDADLVIEAVPEIMDLKKRIFRTLDASAPRDAILASNTSSLSVTAIQEASDRPERVLGMHFFNPVHIMRLLELIQGDRTSDDVVETARAFGERIGKVPIVAQDRPGFATSRLGIVIGNEAMRMLEEGVASAEDIDTAMKLGYGHPMGPFELSDLVGLDVRLEVSEYLHRELGGVHYAPPGILSRLVKEGKLGRKSGEGFYKY